MEEGEGRERKRFGDRMWRGVVREGGERAGGRKRRKGGEGREREKKGIKRNNSRGCQTSYTQFSMPGTEETNCLYVGLEVLVCTIMF